jgi:hypothetical protein
VSLRTENVTYRGQPSAGSFLFYRVCRNREIASAGEDYLVPTTSCQACSGPTEIKLALLPPQQDDEA